MEYLLHLPTSQPRRSSLAAMVEDFLASRQLAGRSRHTIILYRQILSRYDQFIIDRSISWDSPTGPKLFLASLREQGYKDTTLWSRYLVLNTFFNYLVFEKHLEENPLKSIPRIKKPKNLPRSLESGLIERLLAACDPNTFEGIRNRFLVMLLLGTGIRRGEVIQIKLSDINEDSRVIHVHGKGDKDRMVPFGEKLAQEMEYYLPFRSRLDGVHPFLLIARTGQPLKYSAIRGIIQGLAKQAGIKAPVSAHKFRHSYASRYLKNGGRISDLSENMGHSSIGITEIYLKASASERQKEAARCDPLKDFD